MPNLAVTQQDPAEVMDAVRRGLQSFDVAEDEIEACLAQVEALMPTDAWAVNVSVRERADGSHQVSVTRA